METLSAKSAISFKAGWLVIFLIVLVSVSHAQIPLVKGDTLVLIEEAFNKINPNPNFVIVPGPVYGNTAQLGFVILPVYFYNIDKKDMLSPPSSSAAMVFFDFHGSWTVAFNQSLYWGENKWRGFASAGYGKMNRRFFGIGNDTVVLSNDPEQFFWSDIDGGFLSVSCYRRLFRSFYGGLEYGLQNYTIDADDTANYGSLMEGGINPGEKIVTSILIPSLVWDSRNDIFWSNRGYYATLNFHYSDSFFSDVNEFQVIVGSVTGYHKLKGDNDRLTLAWYLYLQHGWGEIPYSRLAQYGSSDNVKGYRAGKYIDNSEIAAQVEVRRETWKFIALGGYFGTGKVFPSPEKFGQSVWLHFGGLRTYVNILPSRNIRLKLDFAIARKDSGFYVGIGQGL